MDMAMNLCRNTQVGYFAFTRDSDYLRTLAYPAMKEVCEYWLDRLKDMNRAITPKPDDTRPEDARALAERHRHLRGGLGGNALYIDTEETFRPEWIVRIANHLGLDPVRRDDHVGPDLLQPTAGPSPGIDQVDILGALDEMGTFLPVTA
jgi:hypothetical protein